MTTADLTSADLTAAAAAIAVSALCGSIPFAVIIGRLKGVDIRAVGSRNAGATNLGRTLGFRYFLLCFALDAAKGLVPVAAIGAVMGWSGLASLTLGALPAALWLAAVAAAVAGHMFSPWIGFKGGKGVATGLGAVLGVFPALTLPGLGALLVFLGVLWVWRYVSLASVLAAASLPVWVWYFFRVAAVTLAEPAATPSETPTALAVRQEPYLAATILVAAAVILKHRANLRRLTRGEEPKVGAGPARATDDPPTTSE